MSVETKKSVHRKKKKTQSYYLKLAVCFLIIAGFLYTLVSQQLRLISIRQETAQCEREISSMEKEYDVLKEKAKYNSTDEFYEDKARDEGYVREDETLFVVGN